LAPPEAECRRYADLLAAHPLDLCCLGIGENGHLAFNDPPVADFDDDRDVKVVVLDDACRRQQVNEGHFAGDDDVPEQAVTVTIPALLRAARVLAIVPEARKAEPVRSALEGPITTACPASILQQTPHATVFLDADSARLLSFDRERGVSIRFSGPSVGRPQVGLSQRSRKGKAPGPCHWCSPANTSWARRSAAPNFS
jgi:6-phosphogluconolactonase/glucosamine-6-phosphate isomerase/deaminase